MDDQTKEDDRTFLQQVIDCAEGKIKLSREELRVMGLTLITQGMRLGPLFSEMCGSEELAGEKLALMRDLIQMGAAPTTARQ